MRSDRVPASQLEQDRIGLGPLELSIEVKTDRLLYQLITAAVRPRAAMEPRLECTGALAKQILLHEKVSVYTLPAIL